MKDHNFVVQMRAPSTIINGDLTKCQKQKKSYEAFQEKKKGY